MTEDPPLPTPELVREYEWRPETAYAAMYDAPSHDQKDLKDDAAFYLARVIGAPCGWRRRGGSSRR
jgi:hypothetical protein